MKGPQSVPTGDGDPSGEADASTRIVVSGRIDREVVDTVETAVRAALSTGPRVEVDVRAVEGWGDDAVRGLAECARLGPGVEFVMDGKRRVPGSRP